MNPKLIVIDGKTYHSVDEMPPDVRQKYEQAIRSLGDANDNHIPDAFEPVPPETVNILADKDKNGIPDVLEYLTAGHAVVNRMKIIIDGKEFNGIENLPPEARARYEEAMGKLDANKNGIPDFLEGMLNAPKQTIKVSTKFKLQTPHLSSASTVLTPDTNPNYVQDNPAPIPSTITPDTSNGWMLALAGLFVLFLCVAGAAGVWYFFLR